jgi:hypothetical protein
MPVAGGPKITTTGILLEVDAADRTSYSGTGTTWTNQVRPGTFNGTLNNISFDSNDSRGALIFTGSNTFVDFGNLGPSLTSSFSFQVAFKPAATASGQPYTILSYASASATSSYTFKLDYTSSNQTVVLTTFAGTGSQNIVYAISASAASGSWNVVHGTFGSQLAALYVNGLGQAYAPTTGSTVGYNTSNRLYAGLNFGSTSSYFTGSVGNIMVNNADLGGLDVNRNYNAIATRFSLPIRRPVVTDADAFAFIEAAGIVDPTQQAAVNTLVIGLKTNNLWTKMRAIYPFVGGTASSHRRNLKTPGTYDIIFSGGIIHTAQGSITTATNAIGDTQFIPTTMLANVSSSAHMSINLAVGTTPQTLGVMGTGLSIVQSGNGTKALQIDTGINGINQSYSSAYTTTDLLLTTTTDKQGLFAVTRTSNTDVAIYRRSPVQTINSLRTALPFSSFPSWENHSIYLFQLRNASAIGVTGSFATIGDGLTQTDVNNLYSAITTFNTTLGRT